MGIRCETRWVLEQLTAANDWTGGSDAVRPAARDDRPVTMEPKRWIVLVGVLLGTVILVASAHGERVTNTYILVDGGTL